jgi:hypothetical protein
MRAAVLVAAVGLGWAAALAAVTVAYGPGHLRPSLAGLVLCLVPALATLRLVERVAGRPEAVTAVAAGIGVRMAVAVAGVVLLGESAAAFGGRDRLTGWVAAMYVLTLAAESALAAHAVRSAGRPAAGR